MAIRAPYRSLRGISAVVALLAIGAVGCSDVSDAVGSAKDGAKKVARQRSVFSLDVGDCYNPNGKAEGEAFAVEVVPCDEAHEGQVVGEFAIDEGKEYPGDDGVSTIADDRCLVEAQKYAPDTWALPQGVGLSHYTPTKESWATGDRAVSCTYTAEKGTFSGSLNTAKSLKPEQTAYLNGSNAVYEALWANQPEKDTVEDDLAGYKAQAKAVTAALDAHVEGLDGIEGAEVGKLRATLTKAAGNWKKAANAADADAFYLAYDPAFTDIDPNKSVAARKELGLATTVPADEAEVWAG
ncbi:septum formation family protein [Streptomyces hirsutus]|uniref:Septum formation family protein n=1 Tax=Streptomyces hirsutus TaxID=35620 RepID=A0ABZ1GMW9_9ACTN|nr:septum formation family protein [Streptomyces hirsutus]WSD06636.1 septum formation family protein [Streptomyces hirsutus]WTD19966.1 septum formation family protein [Streptomyces hirsutus]WTD75131.1 septum formation family protein [Streptomyces sp. NBC_01635]